MEFQPWMEWLVPVLCALLTGTGIWAFLAARATAKATREAAAITAAPAVQQATTADWNTLMTYWQTEMAQLRASANSLEVRVQFLERQREDDLQHIEDLEQHIWHQLPPPPPARRKPQAP